MDSILKNWKTTGLAIVAILVTFVPLPIAFPKIQLLGIVVALGLFFAGDADGGGKGRT